MKRSALRHPSLEKLRAWKRRSKPLRPRSDKMKAVYEKRRPFVKSFLEANPWCQARLAGCWGRSVDVHELVRRAHGAALYPGQDGKRETTYLAVCRPCHDWIGSHPILAKEHGPEIR